MEPYVVREGEHLLQIAAQRGFDALDVWNDPKNKSLRDEGREPHLLAAGDLLWVPEVKPQWLPVRVGQVNKFTTPMQRMRIDVALVYGGTPLASEPCMVETNPPETVTTDASGVLTATVRAQTKELTVKVPRLALTVLLKVGHLDPIATGSGVHQRLQNLGHLGPALAGC